MNELLLIGNPRRRRRKGKSGARRASRKQIAARRRFAAMARSRGKSRRRVSVAVSNPRRRSRGSRRFAIARRRFRRNPIGGNVMRSFVPMVKTAGMGATGAIVNDIAYGFAAPFLPTMLSMPATSTGGINPGYIAGKTAMALALGMATRRFLGPRSAQMTEGALTVTFYQGLRQLISSFGLGLPLGYINPGRVVPPLPISQNLRKYVGPGRTTVPSRPSLRMYVGGASRESVVR